MGNIDKEAIRRFVIKHRTFQVKSTKRVLKLVEERFKVTLSARTVRHWVQRFKQGDWDFRDKSRKPHTIHYKMSSELEGWIVNYKKHTGFDSIAIQNVLTEKHTQIPISTIKRVIRKHNLQEHTRMKGERLNWIRWQRDTPNSLWQLDHTEEEDGTIRLPAIDDCSRYCLALQHWDRISTEKVTKLLDELIARYGKPRQILTDNGSIYQKKFDIRCERRKIEHLHSKINKPTTTGKVEKIHDTYKRAIKRWKNPETWRPTHTTTTGHTEAYAEKH